jgi:hypothetical protein
MLGVGGFGVTKTNSDKLSVINTHHAETSATFRAEKLYL